MRLAGGKENVAITWWSRTVAYVTRIIGCQLVPLADSALLTDSAPLWRSCGLGKHCCIRLKQELFEIQHCREKSLWT